MVFITGASSGIGAATAFRFAESGIGLILLARREDRLREIKGEIQKRHSVPIELVTCDVRDNPRLTEWGARHTDLLKKVTVLVNNAGLAKGLDTIQEGTIDDWDVTIDTNIKGLLHTTRLLLPYFIERASGHIVNIGSVAGRWAYPKGNVYCASKAAVAMLNESMRIDLNGSGIRVTEISPGMVNTEFSLVRLGDKKRADAVYENLDVLTAADIADAIHWCVSRPPRVNIQELVIYPTDQAAPGVVTRRKASENQRS